MAYWAGEIAAIGSPASLLEMVADAIRDEPFGDEPEAAVLAVARWLRAQGVYTAAALLEREAGE